MKKKIVMTLATFVLAMLPFLIGTSISTYTPYVEANSFQAYVIIWSAISIALVSTVLLIIKYFGQSLEKTAIGGTFLFLLICPIIGIYGLAAAPDLSLRMIEHPEREHLRYIFLFVSAILFGGFVAFLFINHSLKVKPIVGWIMALVFAIAFSEFIWEFNHHYLYPEALAEWIGQGRKIEDFGKNYDHFGIVTIGSIGRYFQFISVIWLSTHLYKLRQVKIWCPIVSILVSAFGIISATVVFVTRMNLPKGFEILWLFFIPGIPFILLYWIGVALMTNVRKSKVADPKTQPANGLSANPINVTL